MNENISILDKILKNKKEDELINFDISDIINNLFSELSKREKDIIIRRYGMLKINKETLESIGNSHKLTRERIRQIEFHTINKLKQLKNLENHLKLLKKIITQLLEEHGGFMEKEYMLDTLSWFSANNNNFDNNQINKNCLNFIILKFLNEDFLEIKNLKFLNSFYKLKYFEHTHLEEIVEELSNNLKENDKIQNTENIFKLIKNFKTYNIHKEKLKAENNFNIVQFSKSDLFNENLNVINNNKPLYSILKVFKNIKQNKFGYWGHYKHKEIKPKTINDKIYTVLKYKKNPVHFTKIAKIINEIKFDNKIANSATVHNELILNNRYVLVGRGLYGLKEWGLKKGTVAETIEDILNKSDKLLSRDEIIEKVLKKRKVKSTTIILALMNKNKFANISGKYKIVD